jgi:hypothetical protein
VILTDGKIMAHHASKLFGENGVLLRCIKERFCCSFLSKQALRDLENRVLVQILKDAIEGHGIGPKKPEGNPSLNPAACCVQKPKGRPNDVYVSHHSPPQISMVQLSA